MKDEVEQYNDEIEQHIKDAEELHALAKNLGRTKFDCAELNTKLMLKEITLAEAKKVLREKFDGYVFLS